MIDDELLKPSREHLARLNARIKAMEAETIEKIGRYPDDNQFARDQWRKFYLATKPMRDEQEAVVAVIVAYYAAQPLPPQIIGAGQG